jgi:ketosteroid isomerase-like protein
MKKLSVILFVAVIVFACQPKTETASSSAADEAAIRKVLEENLTRARALNKDNAQSYVSFIYTEDAVIFPPNMKRIEGQQALTEYYQNYPQMTGFDMKNEELKVLGEFAYLRDNWSFSLPNQETANDSGTIFTIWHKQSDGSWKIWREIWHSDIPAPESASMPQP